MPKKLARLPRQTVWVDKRGRFTIPEYLREAAGIEAENWVEVVAEPNLEICNAKGIRSFTGNLSELREPYTANILRQALRFISGIGDIIGSLELAIELMDDRGGPR